MDVGGWLRSLGLECYAAAFHENAVHAELLPSLTADDLKDLGVSLVGHRRQILEAIAALNARMPPTEPSVPGPPVPPTGPTESLDLALTAAERRPLTMVFCDIVGSTALSVRLDPEDLSEVIRGYQARVEDVIRQFDGFIAHYAGDGVLVYFGWPQAHETDTVRAVRAALAITSAVNEVPVAGQALEVHIGVATGLVVVGELIGSGDARQQAAIGETPNRAARLQVLAGPNQVVIDAATRRQIGGLFTCQDLGTVDLKGLPKPVPVWQVLAENRALGQFEALRSELTPLVGREEELDLLLRRWAQAKDGSGRVVLISAEAGTGKSRLAAALVERIAAEPHALLRYSCSPAHQDSAFFPLIAQMERVAGFAQGDTPDTKLAKLQALLTAAELSEEDVALLADLHGLRAAGPPLLPDLAPQRRKERMFAALLCQIERMARRQPVLIVVDDIHWIDPSSREWLDRLIERAGDWPVLLLALFRPEFQPPWAGQPRVTIMTLPRLDRRETTAMVASVAKAASRPADVLLAPEVVAQIAERTDGVPLFVEELTKAVLEAGEQAPGLLSAVPDPAVPVPAALHASLMARLDRLGATAREVAQAGAVIGREFSHTMLASIVGLPEPRLREALDRLTTAGLVFARGMPPGASYQFKHALVQDAAYGSLVRSRRQSLHQRAVAVIAEQMPDLAQAQPAMLAQHSAAAGLMKQAVTYWLKAARQADARSALPEAAAQARKGLEALSTLPDGPWRQQQELGLQYMLAVALTQAQGFPAAEIVRAFTRARALAEGLDRPEYVVRLISKQSGFHVMRAEYKQILSLGSEIESVGGIRGDTALTEVGLLWQGIARLYLGDIVAALAILEEHANPSNTPPELIYAGVHVAAIALTSRALAHLGHVDKARARLDEALSLTRRGGMSWLLAIVLLSANALDLLCGSPPAHVDELEALATEQGLLYYLSWALAFRGLTLDALGRAREASALLTEAFAQLSGRGAVTNLPMLLTWLARVSFRLGHPVEAWRYLAEARQRIETTGERVLEAEVLYRVPGDLLYAVGDLSEAERHYRQAIAVAERQSAKLLQLRAATSLARLLRDQGRRTEARDVLGPIYDWFTEGFDTPVLREARVLLDELA